MNKRFAIISAILLIVFLGIGAKKVTWDNIDFLLIMAEGLDEPSESFYIVLNRVYELAQDEYENEILSKYISEKKNLYLINLYIRVPGVMGNLDTSRSLHETYQHFTKKGQRSTIYYTIKSFGNLGDETAVPLLEELLKTPKDPLEAVSQSTISSALYLITGKNHPFINSSGNTQDFILTKELISARDSIKASKDRKRTITEMLTIDKVYHKPSDI